MFSMCAVCTWTIKSLIDLKPNSLFAPALALRSRGLVIGSREKEREEKEEKEEEKEREEEEEEEKNLQIAIRCLWDLFD